MNILIKGNTAREHAEAWKFAESRKVDNIYCDGETAGIKTLCINIPNEYDKENTLYLKSEPYYHLRESYYELPCFYNGCELLPIYALFVEEDRAYTEQPESFNKIIETLNITVYKGFSGIINFNISTDKRTVLSSNKGFGQYGAQAVLPVLRGDLSEMLKRCSEGKRPEFSVVRCCAVMKLLAEEGQRVSGLSRIPGNIGVFIDNCKYQGYMKTCGGTALYLAARGESIEKAAEALGSAVKYISFIRP